MFLIVFRVPSEIKKKTKNVTAARCACGLVDWWGDSDRCAPDN